MTEQFLVVENASNSICKCKHTDFDLPFMDTWSMDTCICCQLA